MKIDKLKLQRWPLGFAFCALATGLVAQTANDDASDEDVYTLSPFEVTTNDNVGYLATSSLAGTRLKTDLRDVGSAISVVTAEFLQDTGATDNESLLMYTTSGEVGGIIGNYAGVGNAQTLSEDNRFANPSTNTRVRGLAAADNTRNYFLTDIPWDGYNVERVDMQRGPNSILFGLGSPAGIINNTLDTANFINSGKVEARVGQYGTGRLSFNVNRAVIEDELGVRVAGLTERQKYQQDGAFEDDDRMYMAMRWEPAFLKKNGMLTSFRVNVEKGDITRNNPRTLPPIDKITPWFDYMNKETFDPYETQDNYNMLPGLGARRPTYENGDANPYYNPWVGNFAQVFGGALAIFSNPYQTEPTRYYQTEIRTTGYGLAADGSIDGDIGIPYQRPNGIKGYKDYAKDAGLIYSDYGQYKDIHLTDPTIFDFYNKLIDGPNKEAYQKWDAFNVTLTQTFLDNKIGVEAVFDSQSYEDGQFSMLAGERYSIYIDIDHSYANGEANPNVGRPFVSDSAQFGNGMNKTERESMRLTAFGELDFRDFMEESSWLTRLLGRHVMTVFANKDSSERENRSWQRYGTNDAYGAMIGVDNIDDNWRAVNTVTYLGDSLANRSSASGANIPAIAARQIPTDGMILRFDPTWNPPAGINPGDPWTVPYRESDPSTQSENPSNYVGWVQQPLGIVRAADSQAAQDALTTSASLSKDEIESTAFVMQSYFWDGAIVGTYGYRKDTAKAWSYQAPKENGRSLLNDFQLPGEASNEISGISRSWSAVVHLDEILGEKLLPFGLSVYYNESENFQPAAGRADIYGTPLPAPNGTTEDYGVMISTKDGKYSMKINWYETRVNLASSDAIAAYSWFLGTGVAWGYNWANIYQYEEGPDWRINYQPWTGQTPEEAAALEQEAVAAWYANQPTQKFLDAWNFQIDGENTQQRAPSGFTATEDTVSKGVEIEFTANPTSNWRITANIAKQEASRSNVGGVTLNEFIEERTNTYNNTAAGDLRIWWGGSTDTTLRQWNNNFLSNYALVQLLEGTAVPELRKWRVNVVTNYDFSDGTLKGLNVGGAYRWQDKVIIGYPMMEVGDAITYDLDNPTYGPDEGDIDLWVGYSRAVTDKIDWRIQLNVRNVGKGDDLIPITTQPDGSWAGVRIAPSQVWSLTNTFTF